MGLENLGTMSGHLTPEGIEFGVFHAQPRTHARFSRGQKSPLILDFVGENRSYQRGRSQFSKKPQQRLIIAFSRISNCIRSAEPYPRGRAGRLTVAAPPGSPTPGVIMHASISRSRRSHGYPVCEGRGPATPFPRLWFRAQPPT